MSSLRVIFLISLLGCVVLADSSSAAVNKWTTRGPFGGTVGSFLFYPKNPAIIFATAGLAGFYRSTDAGLSWKKLPVNVEGWVSMNPTNGDLLMIANYSSLHILISHDAGETWRPAFNNLPVDRILDLEFHPTDPRVIFLVAQKRRLADQSLELVLYKSSDSGTSWNRLRASLLGGHPQIAQLVVSPERGNPLYLLLVFDLRPADIVKSTDGGNTWVSVKNNMKLGHYPIHLAIDLRTPQTLYVGGTNDIFKTVNGGKSWSPTHCGCASMYAMDGSNPPNLVAGWFPGSYPFQTVGISKSNDGGLTWSKLPVPDPYPNLWSLTEIGAHPKRPGLLLVGTYGGGIFRSEDGGLTWKLANAGLRELGSVRVIATPGHLYSISRTFDQAAVAFEFTSNPPGWHLIPGLDNVTDLKVHPLDGNLIAVASDDASADRISVSTDGGKTWQVTTPSRTGGRAAIALDPLNPNTMYLAQGYGVAKSTDTGKTWTAASSGLASKDLWTITMTPDGSTLFVGTGTGYHFEYSGGIYKSTDRGATWIRSSKGLPTQPLVSQIAADRDGHAVYALVHDSSHGSMVFQSSDGGNTWLNKSQGLPNQLKALVADPTHSNRLFALSGNLFTDDAYLYVNDGIYVSDDAAEHWRVVSSFGLPKGIEMFDLAVDPTNSAAIFLGTRNGIYSFIKSN